ncbi:MAG: hypothetical protein LBH14_02865 [Desulfobulbaceae bacterium]|jgi:tetratricopeptide (TPR) repeat protein|nr:hypothetical protein [Desulfobulbaceae bacterium]
MKRKPFTAPFLLLLAVALAAAPTLFPGPAHGLEVAPLAEQETPAWFRLWQQARDWRGHDDQKAAQAYQQLLQNKPDLEEARWEYCQLLVSRHEDATAVCEPLPEASPNNKNYLLMAGRLALATREYSRAVSYLQKCADTSAPGNNDTMRLLVEALDHLGEVKKSLPYLENLAQAHPDDLDLLWRLFTAARQAGDNDRASAAAISLSETDKLPPPRLLEVTQYLEKASGATAARAVVKAQEHYLQLHPDYLPFRKALATTYLTGKDATKALPHLTVLAEAGEAAPGQLADLARLHSDRGDLAKALHYYEMVRALRPDDTSLASETSALRKKFAKSLIAGVQRDNAPEMWDNLDRIDIDRLALYTVLAEEMEKSGKWQGLLQLLEVLRDKSPEPDRYSLRIARLLAAGGDDAGALKMMQQVRRNNLRDAGYFRERAAIETRLGLIKDALADYRQAIVLKPGDMASHGDAIALAAEAGLASELPSLAPGQDASVALWLAWLNGLADNGLFMRAVDQYGRLLASGRLSAAEKQQLREQRAAMYARMGRLAEAEQEYRLLLADTVNAPDWSTPTWLADRQRLLLDLIELLLDGRETAEAGQWLALAAASGNTSLDEHLALARWRLNLQRDGGGAALDQLRKHIDGLAATKGYTSARLTPWRRLLTEGCIARRDLAGAKKALAAIAGAARSGELAALSLLAQANPADGGQADGAFSRYRHQLAAARLAEHLGLLAVAADMATAALQECPDSLAAQAMQARLSMSRAHFPEAARQYQHLQEQYPDEIFFRREYLTALLAAGQTSEFRERLAANPVLFPAMEEELLLARADWQDGKSDEAIHGYETLLSAFYPDNENAKRRNEDSLWTIFSFSDPEELTRLERATDPGQFWPLRAGAAESSAQDFARQRFEQVVRQEYMARRSLASRQYKSAERQYRRSLQSEPTVSGWRDLAKIYERLGQYGKEAAIYSALSEQGLDNPELRGDMAKNRLLRAPRLSFNWSEHSQEGRQDMKNIRENTFGASVWMMPSLTSEATIEAKNINYSAARGGGTNITGRSLLGKTTIELNDNNIFTGQAGVHITDGESGQTMLLYDLALRHRFDQMLQGFIRVNQEVLDDTLISVSRGYSRQSYGGGLELDAPSGFALGTELAYNHLASDNGDDRINMWAGYSFFGEFSTLSLKYEYLLAHENKAGALTVDPLTGIESNSLAYWSPGHYWLQQASASYRYLLQGLGFPGQNDSYYSISLSTGYESNDSLLVSGNFDISLELTRHFLLKGNLLFSKANDFEEKGAFLSLVYRW